MVAAFGPVQAQEKKTFRVWWFETPDSAMGIVWAKAIEVFKTKHPDVEVQFEQKSWDQIQKAGTELHPSAETLDLSDRGLVVSFQTLSSWRSSASNSTGGL